MLPPLIMSDRPHMRGLYPNLQPKMPRSLPQIEEFFDYRMIAARPINTNRSRITKLQFPMQGSFLSPQTKYLSQPSIPDPLNPAPVNILTELHRTSHLQNLPRLIIPNRLPLYHNPSGSNSSRMEHTRMNPYEMDEYIDPAFYIQRPEDVVNRNLDTERRKIDSIISNGHKRSHSNLLINTPSRPSNIHYLNEASYNSANIPRHVSELEKYGIKVRKNTHEPHSPQVDSPKVTASADSSPLKKTKLPSKEDKAEGVAENDTLTKKKKTGKKTVFIAKDHSDDIRKQAILNNSRKKRGSSDKNIE